MPLREGKHYRLHLAELAVRPYRRLVTYLMKKGHLSAISDRDARIAVLTRELEDAYREQAATADILKVISRSAFDLQAVLDTLAESATRLCGAEQAFIYRYDGEFLRVSADHGASSEFRQFRQLNPARRSDGSLVGRAAAERSTIHTPDVLADPDYKRLDAQKLGGYRSLLTLPMLRGETLLGVIQLWRTKARPFTDKQIEVATTFADQAVIAIENTRLFEEVQARTGELQEALEYQTATSDVLRAISGSAFDLQPILDTLVESASGLCRTDRALLHRLIDGKYRISATYGGLRRIQEVS